MQWDKKQKTKRKKMVKNQKSNYIKNGQLVMKKKSKKHPGFKAVQKSIEKEGYPKEQAGAILASKTRNASKKAKAKNPKLKKVK